MIIEYMSEQLIEGGTGGNVVGIMTIRGWTRGMTELEQWTNCQSQ